MELTIRRAKNLPLKQFILPTQLLIYNVLSADKALLQQTVHLFLLIHQTLSLTFFTASHQELLNINEGSIKHACIQH